MHLGLHKTKFSPKPVMVIGLQQTNYLGETQGPRTKVFRHLMSADHKLTKCSLIT